MLLNLIHNVLLFVILIAFAVYLFIISYKFREENRYGFNSVLLTASILLFLAFIILSIDWLLPYPLNAAINIWIGIISLVQCIYYIIMRIKFKETGDKENIEESSYENGEIKVKRELLRKSFHSVIILVIFCYYYFAPWINRVIFQVYLDGPDLYHSIWNITEYPLPPTTSSDLEVVFSWTLMLFISALLLLLIPDAFRIYNRKYSIFSGVYKKVIRLKELYTVGPQIYLTLGCTFIFLLAVLGIFIPSVTLAAMLIAAFGDAAAAIFGRKYGKHRFKTVFQKDELKSYEGLIAGFLVSYFSAFFIVGPWIALMGALTFTVLDLLNPNVADNVSNPILCTLVMMIPYWITI
ncbi:MAG: hypothetical protein R6U96_07505 [Promethearchaeia archaeon]